MEQPNKKHNKLNVTDKSVPEISACSNSSDDSIKTTESLEREKLFLAEEKDEYYVPLVAKDSEWADVTFHHPKWKIPKVKPKGAAINVVANNENNDALESNSAAGTDVDLSPSFVEDDEVEVTSVNPNDDLPIYALFPNLRTQYPHAESILKRRVSTTDIAKSLVGEKPNFSVMKMSGKLQPTQTPLASIEEINHEMEPESSVQSKSSVKENSYPPLIEYKELQNDHDVKMNDDTENKIVHVIKTQKTKENNSQKK